MYYFIVGERIFRADERGEVLRKLAFE